MSFCDLVFQRKDGKVTVQKPGGGESVLFPRLVSFAKEENVYKTAKPYFDDLIEQGKLLDGSDQETALGLYAIAAETRLPEEYFIGKERLLVPKEEPMSFLDTDSKTYLKEVFEKGLSRDNRLLAKRLLSVVDKNVVQIRVERTDGAMTYDYRDNTIRIDPATLKGADPVAYEEAVLHEIVHSLSVHLLYNNKKQIKLDQKFYGWISQIVDEMEKRVPEASKNDPLFYAFNHKGANKDSKIAEFIAEYMSRRDFSDWVDKRLSDKKNFVQRIADFIANLLGNKLLASAIQDYMSKSQIIKTTEQRVEKAYENILEDFARVGNILDNQKPFGELVSRIAEINKSVGAKVLETYNAPDGTTRVRINRENMAKVKNEAREGFKKEVLDNNAVEERKERRGVIESIVGLSHLSEEEKKNATRLLQTGKFPIQCGL